MPTDTPIMLFGVLVRLRDERAHRSCDRCIPTRGDVLIVHRDRRRRVAETTHELPDCRTGLGGEHCAGVAEIVHTDVLFACRERGLEALCEHQLEPVSGLICRVSEKGSTNLIKSSRLEQ